jgi:hypothetical protein
LSNAEAHFSVCVRMRRVLSMRPKERERERERERELERGEDGMINAIAVNENKESAQGRVAGCCKL